MGHRRQHGLGDLPPVCGRTEYSVTQQALGSYVVLTLCRHIIIADTLINACFEGLLSELLLLLITL